MPHRLLVHIHLFVLLTKLAFWSATLLGITTSLYLVTHGYQRAGSVYESVLRYPRTAAAHRALAQLWYAQGDSKQALVEEQRADTLAVWQSRDVLGIGNEEQRIDTHIQRQQTSYLHEYTYWTHIANEYPFYRDAQFMAAIASFRLAKSGEATMYATRTKQLSDTQDPQVSILATYQ